MRKQSRPASVIQPGHPGTVPAACLPCSRGSARPNPVDLPGCSQCRHDEGNATTMRGIVSIAGYVPYRRLQRSAVAEVFGTGGGKGTRAVASHDEDTTTMGVEAARLALRPVPGAGPDAIWFATATPAYLDKTNATTIHAALRQAAHVAAFDFGGALRSGTGALAASAAPRRPTSSSTAGGPPATAGPRCGR